MLMENLYRSLLLESLEDSAAKYQKDIDKVQAVAKTISTNEGKFKKDFMKYFYQENGERDTNNADTEGSQEDYMKSGSEEVARYLVHYIIKLLGGDVNESDITGNKHSNYFSFNINTYTNLPFTGFRLVATVRVTPNSKNKPGKKFLFDIDLDNSDAYLMPEDTNDRDFTIPDEPYKYDILTYKDFEYKENKLKSKFKAFKDKYENDSTAQVIRKIWTTLEDTKGEQKDVKGLYKFTESFIKAVAKHLKLKTEGSVESRKDFGNYHSFNISTDLGLMFISVYLDEGHFSLLEDVELSNYPDKVILYKKD